MVHPIKGCDHHGKHWSKQDSQTVSWKADWTKRQSVIYGFSTFRERPIKGFLTTHTLSPSNDYLLSCELLNAAEKTSDQSFWSRIIKKDRSWFRANMLAIDLSLTSYMKWLSEQSLVRPLSQPAISRNRWMWYSSSQWVTSHKQSDWLTLCQDSEYR